MEALDTNGIETSSRTTAESRLWAEALALLVRDAAAHQRGKRVPGTQPTELEAAFYDVMQRGPMLRRCCSYLDVDATDVQQAFIAWIERGSITK